MVKYDVFLSYAHGDDDSMIPYAHRIYDELISAGFTVWFDKYNIGKDTVKSMRTGVSQSSIFVALLSPEYMRSDNCNFEFSVALGGKKPILCCAVKPGKYYLNGIESKTIPTIKLTPRHFHKGVKTLVAEIQGILK